MLGPGTYKTRGGYRAHVTERGLRYWYGTIEGAGAGGDPGPGVWMDDGRDYYGYDVFDILLPTPPPTVEETEVGQLRREVGELKWLVRELDGKVAYYEYVLTRQ